MVATAATPEIVLISAAQKTAAALAASATPAQKATTALHMMSTDPGQECGYDYDCSGEGGETSSTNVNNSVGSNRRDSQEERQC